jgi:uncharacterized protein with FMN-binding domain
MTMKKILIGVLIVLIIIAVAGGIALKNITDRSDAELQKLLAVEIKEVDLSKIENGTYTGTYQAFPIEVEVKVVVADHKITGIDLVKHNTGKGQAAEALPAKVVETQSLKVDTITGATYSSKVILLAIQDALSK